ncbi:MAG TPA: hypothetical protein VN281_17955 [Verrucomicrobiae bacterium]|nr:hypothetical protein [Verrucomicrobiae bacterium]
MINRFRSLCGLFVSLAGVCAIIQSTQAQPFVYNARDLLLTFRIIGNPTWEVVVDAGQATNYNHLTPGATITISNYTSGQLSNAFGVFANLTLGASACVSLGGVVPNYPANTIWVTDARANSSVQSTPYTRVSGQSAQPVVSKINTIGNNAAGYNGVSDPLDTTTFLEMPMGSVPPQPDTELGPNGDFVGNFQADIENTTPASFTSPVRSDLYFMLPNGVADPKGATNGPAYYLGYFEFSPSGRLTFTAAGGSTTQPPKPTILSITRSNNVNSILFTTTNSATYTLFFTNSIGLSTPASNWPSSPATLTGTGGNMAFQDTYSGSNRFYRIGAH